MLPSFDLTCEVCFESFLSAPSSSGEDRRPRVLCANGHSFCSLCCSSLATCPICRADRLDRPIVNIALLKALESCAEALESIPEIPPDEVTLEEDEPIAMGAYADVLLCRWSNQLVAVKRLRVSPQSDQMRSLRLETSLAIGLLHPNVVRLYGSVRMTGGLAGIVMEWADQGSLRDKMGDLSQTQKVGVSLCVCDGLAYLHAKKVAHRDLKPENVLLFGASPTAKISDFGTSRVIQTMVTNTSMAGTPKYTAPELLQAGMQYGASVDVFSVAMMLYELFSGLDPFPGCGTIVQVLTAMIMDKRPVISPDFPAELKGRVQAGWSKTPTDRPPIRDFQSALKLMSAATSGGDSAQVRIGTTTTTTVRAAEQTAEVGRLTMPVPAISMQWSASCERENSRQLRETMVADVRAKCNFKGMITASVLRAMEVVPRHLFMEPDRVTGETVSAKLESVYTYNRAMGATPTSNESSPEIAGVQLSLVKILPGARVLLVGGKGGYVSALVAQMVGVNGRVVTASSARSILDLCRTRVADSSPLSAVMDWRWVDDVSKAESVLAAFGSDDRFHAIIFCGSVASLPLGLAGLLCEGGSLIAPVGLAGDGRQQLQMLLVEEGGRREVRKITEFGVIFEVAK